MNSNTGSTDHYPLHIRRSRSDWCGIRIDDAFRPNVDYIVRSTAHRMFSKQVLAAQSAAVRAARGKLPRDYRAEKAQIAPCYTSWPRGPAAVAAIGMSAYIEFLQHTSADYLREHCLKDEEKIAALQKAFAVSIDDIRNVVGKIASTVEIRLFSVLLGRNPELKSVEVYRLFLASQKELLFTSVKEIIEGVVLFGDIFPPLEYFPVNKISRNITTEMLNVSHPYLSELHELKPEKNFAFGVAWVWALSDVMAAHLPKESLQKKSNRGPLPCGSIPPLDRNRQPMLDNRSADAQLILNASLEFALCGKSGADTIEKEELDPEASRILQNFMRSIVEAGRGNEIWEDPRADLLERRLGERGFLRDPLEGSPTMGLYCSVPLYGKEAASAELFESVMEEEANHADADRLRDDAAPLASEIRRLLYPNKTTVTEMEKIRPSGSLDPSRLAAADFSEAVYRSVKTRRTEDERGKPVLVIAADASSSLEVKQWRMIRLLCAAWILSVRRGRVQLLSCLYHSGRVHPGRSESLVRWIIHPRKTVHRSHDEAIRVLAGLVKGTGTQADAVSLRFIVDEAQKVAMGRKTYLVVFTDAKWNRSFRSAQTGLEEMRLMLKQLKLDYPGCLHTTLIVLGDELSRIDNLIDTVIRVSDDDLQNADAVAGRIARYVASTIKERKRMY
ncbi:MAG: hypothetical protein KFH87_03975 [Bacteroidetes bacterium]|nr:hypothetical protein [Bacteroidota bacterium]